MAVVFKMVTFTPSNGDNAAMYIRLFASAFAALLCPAVISAEEMTFSLAGNGGNCGGCEWIAAEGRIVSDTPKKFQEFMNDYGPYRVSVVFNSEGGNLISGVELGSMIRDLGLWTSIGKTVVNPELGAPWEDTAPGICASACAYAFFGGVERFAEEGELGVHQFYSLDELSSTAETQATVGLLLIHVLQMGIDLEVLARSLFTDSSEMHWFSETELKEYSLTTENMQFSDPWQFEPYNDGLVLTAQHHSNATEAAQMTFFCRKSDGRWRLLISERISNEKHDLDLPRLRAEFESASNIWFSERQLDIDASNLEFLRSDESMSYLSMTLPIDLLSAAGDRFRFSLQDWKTARFMVSANVPESAWLDALRRNCI